MNSPNAMQQRLAHRAKVQRDSAQRTLDAHRGGPSFVASLDRIHALRAQQAQELEALEKSQALEFLWPNVFAGPKPVSTSWRATPLPVSITGPGPMGAGDYALTLRVTNARGATQEFPQANVPLCLWPSPTYGTL